MDKETIQTWSDKVFNDLKSKYDIEKTKFVILAGKNYYSGFIDKLPHTELPLGSLPIGKRVQYLQNMNKKHNQGLL
jgi:hypothetical protein